MSSTIAGDDPAFPNPVERSKSEFGTTDAYPGMSLRTWLAGLAMQGILAGRKCELGNIPLDDFTTSALTIADTLLAKLNTPPGDPS